jgi:hypothetical protein
MQRLAGLILATVGLSPPVGIGAQASPTTLKPPNAEFSDGFSRVLAPVRELADGRIVLIDDIERRLLVVDLQGEKAREIGRAGRGPGEFGQLNGLHALGGDTTLVEDRFSRRWIILVGDRLALTVNSFVRGIRFAPQLFGADTSGRLLDVHIMSFHNSPGVGATPIRPNAESLLAVVRRRGRGLPGSDTAVRLTTRVDTIQWLRGSGRGQTIAWRPVLPGRPPIRWILGNPLNVAEQALLFRDGWIALAFPDPYRVEWITPDGRRVLAEPIREPRVAVDDRVKRAHIQRKYPKAEPQFQPNEFPPWPSVLPAFLNDALLAAPDGRLVVQRAYHPPDDRLVYDWIDRSGRRSGQLVVSANERIVGFGRRSVYVVAKDDDDVEWLRRHPWP